MKFPSVLLSTYEQPNALRMSLEGYMNQSINDFEIIIADDGSSEETLEVIKEYKRKDLVAIEHVWQENKGYRRPKIVNEAFKISKGDTIILSDGDCIPRSNFIETHIRFCGHNNYCVGGYVRLSAEFSEELTINKVKTEEYDNFVTLRELWRMKKIHMKSFLYRLLNKADRPKVYGSNISVGRELFERINGYDENFDGFGKEDSDLRNRLNIVGANPVSVWGKTWVYHIDDSLDPGVKEKRVPRDKQRAKQYYYRDNITARCSNGIVKDNRKKVS